MYDVIIIGAGPAGLTAAIYTCRAKLKTLVLEGNIPGGNAGITDMIENYPGFPEGINGSELMFKFMEQAQNFGAEIEYDGVSAIEDKGEIKKVITTGGVYETRSIIIATGAHRRELEVDGEKEYSGKGVSYCATCDGSFYAGRPVAVVGGGDTAVKEALYLAGVAGKVYLIHRREGFRANESSLEKMFNDPRIDLKLNRVVKKINGDSGKMTELVLADVNSGQEEILQVEGVFVSIGLLPATDFIGELLETDSNYILTGENMMTSVKGIFAAGDVRSKHLRQVATAVGDGAMAGTAVAEYLRE